MFYHYTLEYLAYDINAGKKEADNVDFGYAYMSDSEAEKEKVCNLKKDFSDCLANFSVM